MTTEYSMDAPSGSAMRVKWEVDALRKQGFTNISIIDNFNKNSKKPTNCLIHAQQHTGRYFEKNAYISDIHGIGYEAMWYKFFNKSLPLWKRWGFRTKSHFIKKLEHKIWKNAIHLVCVSDIVYDRVKHFQSATVVKNAVNIDDYPITKCNELKVAVVGPFLPGTQNYEALELLHFCVKNSPKINFEFIGDASTDFKESLSFSNVKFLGRVENYLEVLSGCSVLLSPYPGHSHLLAGKTKMLEAGACQMVVVTSETGELGHPKDLFLVAKSKNDYLEKLQYLQDEKARTTIGKKLRSEISKNYNVEIETKKLLKLYNELLM